MYFIFFFQAEDGIRDYKVTGVQTCALPICNRAAVSPAPRGVKGWGAHVAEQRDYEVRHGKPPVHRRFKKGQVRQPTTEKLAGAAGRGAQRAGGLDHRRSAARSPSA